MILALVYGWFVEREHKEKEELPMMIKKRTGAITKWMMWLLPLVLPLYLVRFRLFGFPTTFLEMYLGLLFFLFTFACGWKGWQEGWLRLQGWRWPVVAWFLVTLLSVFVSPDAYGGFGLWRAYVLEPLLVFVLAAALLRSEEDRSRLKESFFLLVILLAVWSLIQFVTGWGIPHPWNVSIADGRRAVGPFPYPNALALLVVPIAAWAFAEWVQGLNSRDQQPKPKIQNSKAFAFFAWLSGFLVVLLARSDGGLIALLAVTWLAAFFQKRIRPWLIGFTVLGLLLVALTPSIRTPIVREISFQSWSGQVRLFQWRETREMLKDHWFFGAGFGGYPTVFKPYHKATAIEIFQYPHTILLNFWSETGLLGVLVFAWIILTWLHLSFLRRQESHGYSAFVTIAPLLALLIHGLVDVPYFKNDLAVAFWLVAAVRISYPGTKGSHGHPVRPRPGLEITT
jgi:hypothetical protein